MKRTNIQEQLSRAKKKSSGSEKILETVYAVLEQNQKERNNIQTNITESNGNFTNAFDADKLNQDYIYHLDQIKKICIDYRLRFLDSKLFKGAIPEEAISKIRQLEKNHQTELSGFKVLAPSKMFKLKDKDDPILFAPIGNGYFYLIHKWGNDLHPLRRLLMWPFKNVVNLALFTIMVSYMLTLFIPTGLFSKTNTMAEFGILFFFMFKSVAAVVVYYGFAQGKNFSNAIWNSKYINT